MERGDVCVFVFAVKLDLSELVKSNIKLQMFLTKDSGGCLGFRPSKLSPSSDRAVYQPHTTQLTAQSFAHPNATTSTVNIPQYNA